MVYQDGVRARHGQLFLDAVPREDAGVQAREAAVRVQDVDLVGAEAGGDDVADVQADELAGGAGEVQAGAPSDIRTCIRRVA